MKIILASKSPRRKEILENLGVEFEIIVSDADEESGETDPASKILLDIGEKTIAFEYESVSKIKTLFDFDSI